MAFIASVEHASIGERRVVNVRPHIVVVGLLLLGCGASMSSLCANGPEDRDGFEDGDGCAEPDNDQDGLLDADDECPLVPEDRDGDADADGCPESTNCFNADRDGVLDWNDVCPEAPEDRDGVEDDDGCPEPDAAPPAPSAE